jgi:hypothetical protein
MIVIILASLGGAISAMAMLLWTHGILAALVGGPLAGSLFGLCAGLVVMARSKDSPAKPDVTAETTAQLLDEAVDRLQELVEESRRFDRPSDHHAPPRQVA